MDAFIPLIVCSLIAFIAWLIFTSIRRFLMARLQATLQAKLLERINSPETLLTYVSTDAGREFVEACDWSANGNREARPSVASSSGSSLHRAHRLRRSVPVAARYAHPVRRRSCRHGYARGRPGHRSRHRCRGDLHSLAKLRSGGEHAPLVTLGKETWKPSCSSKIRVDGA